MTKPRRRIDFAKYKQRHIALKILYFGWDYSGLSYQEDSGTSIEYVLIQALNKTCLIESREKCKFSRCGRTDKGVSAYGQVVNLIVRSNLIDESEPNNVGLFTPEGYNPKQSNIDTNDCKQRKEIDYVDILNKNLPDEIKVIAWAPIKSDFSSRFQCQSRSYSYIFPIGDLCLHSMQEAVSYLIGQHDFRNLCSLDLKNGVINHVRTILSADIKPLVNDTNNDKSQQQQQQYKFYQMVIVGKAFLYHQIRRIMTIVFLVGSKKENPTVIKDLLDLSKCPAKPSYGPASPLPLCLFDCKYKPEDLPLGWNHDQESLCKLLKQIKQLWWQYKTRSLMVEQVLFDLESSSFVCRNNDDSTKQQDIDLKQEEILADLKKWKNFGVTYDNRSETKYTPLLKRTRDDTLEYKIEVFENKRAKREEDMKVCEEKIN